MARDTWFGHRRLLLVGLLCVMGMLRAAAASFTAVESTAQHLGYYAFLPSAYTDQPEQNFPVMIVFHGLGVGGDGTLFPDQPATGYVNFSPTTTGGHLQQVLSAGPAQVINRDLMYDNLADSIFETNNVIVLVPQLTSGTWWRQNHLRAFLDYAQANYRIDPNRIYFTGYDSGCFGIQHFIINDWQYDDIAAAAVCAYRDYNAEFNSYTAQRLKKVRYWALTARGDWSGGGYAAVSRPDTQMNIAAGAIAGTGSTNCMATYPGGTNPYDDYTGNFNLSNGWQWTYGVDPSTDANPKFTVFAGSDHNSWDRTYGSNYTWEIYQQGQVYQWLFAQTKATLNSPPVVTDDSYSTPEDTPLTVAAPGVLANDVELNGKPMTAVLATNPGHGTVSLSANGGFTYRPVANWNGTDTFTYMARNGATNSIAATVTITVTPVNDAPVATKDSYSIPEDMPLVSAAPGVLGNDTDIEGGALNAIKVTDPAHGTVTLNANGSFTYRPTANWNGTYGFTYKANDGISTSAPVAVTITVSAVNDPPVADHDSFVTNENTPLTIAAPGVIADDTDADGNPLTAIKVSNPAHGTVTLNANGGFTYTPNADWSGIDTFTYKANDGAADSNVATVTVIVKRANRAPVANNDAYTTCGDRAFTVAAPGVLGNDTDAEGNPLTAIKVTDPANGTVTLNADGSFTYTSNTGWTGTDSFTYKANDGTVDSAVATVTLTVTAPNQAPVAGDDMYSTYMNMPLPNAAPGVLVNDSDAEGSALTASKVTDPANGAVIFNADGSFTYTPNADWQGTDSFTYKVNDGTDDSNVATVSIYVFMNNVPVAWADQYSTVENTTLTVTAPGVLSNDTDSEGSTLTASKVTDPAHGAVTLNADGSFTYTPTADWTGTDSFTYKVNDFIDDSAPATVTIIVTDPTAAPVAMDDTYSIAEDTVLEIAAAGVLGNDTGTALMAVPVSNPAHGVATLNADGSFTYTPNADWSGTDSFTYKANNVIADSNVATVTITVNAVNDPPVAGNDGYATDEDTPLTVAAPGVLANDTDTEGAGLIALLINTPGHGAVTLYIDGGFTYTPDADWTGTDSFTYRADDGTTNSNEATVNITVAAVNDAPVAGNDGYSTNEDTPLVMAAPGVLGNDADVEGGALTASKVSDPAHGAVTLNSNGSFTYTPSADWHGTDSFTYQANDGAADSNVATVTITVGPVNDPPIARDDAYSAVAGEPLLVTPPGVLENDSDQENSPLTAERRSDPAHGIITFTADGSFSYVAYSGYSGEDHFTYRASDGQATSNLATVSINVLLPNTLPVAVNDAYSLQEDTVLRIPARGVLANDTDGDLDPLTAALASGPAYGTAGLAADGSFTYTPTANFCGQDQFSYTAFDGRDSATAVVTLSVLPVNDVPVANADQFYTCVNTRLTLPQAGVLANDVDADHDYLFAFMYGSPPSTGSTNLNANGSFTYQPIRQFVGNGYFRYRAYDGKAYSGVTTAYVTVLKAKPVAIDIRPGVALNTITPGTAEDLPVAIFSSSIFDARRLNIATLTLAGASVRRQGTAWKVQQVDLNGDRRLDLLAYFENENLGLTASSIVAYVRGRLQDNSEILGMDTVLINSRQ